MLDSISAHIELIEGNNVFRKVVADRVIRTKLAVDRFVGGEQTAHLLEKLSLCLYFRLYIRQFTFMAPGLLLGQGYCFEDRYRCTSPPDDTPPSRGHQDE